ncbi:hypothetical protein BHM03_00025223 [Ensete ventricosum]|nr:hypothetical protein BHM03_00025223 [Ensete ventricosum]
MTHALAGHANSQAAKVESFKQQLVTFLTNNLMNGKGDQVTICEKHGSEVMTIMTQHLQKLAEISGASTESSRLLPTMLYNLHMLILQEEPLARIRPYCYPHPQRVKLKGSSRRRKRHRPFAMTFPCKDTLSPKALPFCL